MYFDHPCRGVDELSLGGEFVMKFHPTNEFLPIKGVFETKHKRSERMRDAFIASGIEKPNETRYADLRVSDLSSDAGTPVGRFYTRFF